MGCQDRCSQFTALMDFELPPDQARDIESHLASCSDCQAEYESLRLAANLIDQLPAANLSLPPWSSIQARVLPAAPEIEPFRWDFFSPGNWAPVGAAVLALVFSLGLLIPTSMERLKLSRALEEYVHQRRVEETLLETVWGLVDERDLPNPFSLDEPQRINPFLVD